MTTAFNVGDGVEEWRAVRGYEGKYEVSSLGRIKSLARDVRTRWTTPRRTRDRIRAPYANSDGYLVVPLHNEGFSIRFSVHALVARAFVPGEAPGLEVRHLNGDNQDNSASNLAWGTRSENMLDRLVHGTNPQANKTHCPQGHPYDAENTYISPSNKRQCRTCARDRKQDRKGINK